jgi:predicted HD phosphohydrolase
MTMILDNDAARTVSFISMAAGTKADYTLLEEYEHVHAAGTADRILDALRQLDGSMGGYKISRLDHCLQTATRAHRDGADIDMVVTALVHDIGDMLAPFNHDSVAAAILKPYVREECTWITEYHGLYQKKYYIHHFGGDPDARDAYRDHPYHESCIRFCERWDQAAFDPDYETLDLAFFEPMVREVFGREPYDPAHIRPGAVGPA